jgi:hypothetical protein
MSVESFTTVVITVMLSTCLFAQEKTLMASNLQSEADPSFVSAESWNADADPQPSPAPHNAAVEDRWKDPSDWQISIYPVFAWAPIFGISTRELPSSPGGGGGGGIGDLLPPSSTSSSLNGAAFAGFRVEKNKWSTDGTFLWAGLSSERESNPFARISVDAIFGQLMVGREIVPDLFLEGGFRRVALSVSLRLGDFPTVSGKPGVWDPLVGLTYRRQLTKKWKVLAHADGGGFGVGSDVDIAATARAEWQFARHFGLAMGYGLLHLDITRTVAQRSLDIKQTMNGPIFGFGIYF